MGLRLMALAFLGILLLGCARMDVRTYPPGPGEKGGATALYGPVVSVWGFGRQGTGNAIMRDLDSGRLYRVHWVPDTVRPGDCITASWFIDRWNFAAKVACPPR